MHKYLLISFMILGSAFLAGCQTQALNEAEKAYDHKAYPESIEKLMPLASKGDAKAQYALGYMYFYGKGVVRDIKYAKKWIRLAAKQGYLPARQALNMIIQSEAAYSPLDDQTRIDNSSFNPELPGK